MLDPIQSEGPWSEEACRDMGFLEARCRELGLAKLEKALRQAADEHGGVVAAIHRALRAEAHRLRHDAGALSGRIYDRLRCSGWEAARIERELRFPAGLPVPRLRHPVTLSDAELTLEGHEEGIWACAITPDGRRLVSASRDRTLRVWDLQSGEALAVLRGHEQEVRGCAVMPDGRRVVSASADETLKIWDLETGQALATLRGHEARVLACAVTPDGRRIVSASSDRTLRIWDPATGEALAVLRGHEKEVRNCAVTPDGRRVVSASPDGFLKLWSTETGELLATLRGSSERTTSRCPCTVSPDGTRVIVATGDGLQAWDLETLESLATFRGYSGNVMACVVTLDCHHLVAACFDRTLRVWELATGKELAILPLERFGHRDIVLACALTPDGQNIVSACWDWSLRVWSVEAARVPNLVVRPEMKPLAMGLWVVSPDGQRAVSLSHPDALRVWSLDTGKGLVEFAVQSPKHPSAMASGDRRALVQGEQALVAFDLETGREVATLVHDDAQLGPNAVVRGDRWIVFHTPKDRGIHVWDLETCETLTLAEAQRLGCVTTPAQRCALLDRSIVVWDEAGRLLPTVKLHDPDIFHRQWMATPDGRHIVTSTYDGSRRVRVWETATGREIVTLVHEEPPREPHWPLSWFAITPNGRRVVTTCWGGSIRVWDLETGASVAMAHVEGHVGPVAASNEALCAPDRLGNLWIFELRAM